jgi:hypothetical protein
MSAIIQGTPLNTPEILVRAMSTANVITASPGTTLDNVTLVAGNRIWLKNQTTGSQNGPWQFNGSTSALTRTADGLTMAAGTEVTVAEGLVNGDTKHVVVTDDPIVVGTTVIRVTQTSPSFQYPARKAWSIGSTAAARPVICESMDRQIATAAVAQTAITAVQSIHGGMVVPAGRLITNINAFCTAAGAGAVTSFHFSILDAYTRTVLQRTANSTTLPTVNAVHTRALQATLTLDADTPVIIAWGSQVATTSMSFAGTAAGQAALQFQQPYLSGNSGTAPTATPPTVGAVLTAPSAGNASHVFFWLT